MATDDTTRKQQWPAHLEPQYRRIYELLCRSRMLQVALESGAKVDVTIHVNRGQVIEKGPFVTIQECP